MDYSIDEIRSQRQKRADIHKEIREVVARAKNDNDRDLSAEENEQCDRALADSDALKKKIDIMERLDSESRDLEKAEIPVSLQNEIEEVEMDSEVVESRAFENYLRGGISSLNKEQRDIMSQRFDGLEARAQSLTNGAGGYMVPDGKMQPVVTAREANFPMADICTIIQTAEGNDIPIPLNNDATQDGVILAENSQVAEQDLAFTSKTLSAYLYSSKLIRVSLQLLNDSAMDVGAFIGARLGERLARIQNQHATVGTGSSQPVGIMADCPAGKTTAGATAITFGEIVDLVHSVDPAYHNGGKFMFNSSTAGVLKKLVDGQSRPLWLSSMQVGAPDQILGFPYVINQAMDSIATAKKTIAFGDFKSCYVRRAGNPSIIRMEERYADYLQVGFTMFERSDFVWVGHATAHAQIKHLLQA